MHYLEKISFIASIYKSFYKDDSRSAKLPSGLLKLDMREFSEFSSYEYGPVNGLNSKSSPC